ncbi:unnamed protein product [Agarophyton chilense]
MKPVYSLLLLLFAVFLWANVCRVSATNKSSVERCPVNMNREIGSTNVYVWVCKCPLSEVGLGEASNTGFARSAVPSKENDTQGRNEAFLRCAEKYSEYLSRLCFTNGSLFESEAEHIMRDCSNTIPKENELRNNGTFGFDKNNCSTRLVPIVSQFQTGGIWLCECEQPYKKTDIFWFDVVVGRGNFTTNASPRNAVEEINEIERCTSLASQQLQEVCINAPGDFDLLALHLMQACCRRTRALSNAKFECDVWVPPNVDVLKIQRDPLTSR